MLSQIKTEACPNCKAKIREDKRWNQHCTGHWNESRRFDCGAVLSFCPNFELSGVVFEKKCPKLPEERDKRRRREGLLTDLRTMAANGDADKEFRDTVLKALQYVSVG